MESDQIICGNHGSDIVIRHKSKPCPLCRSWEIERALLQLLVDRDILPIVPEQHSWGVSLDSTKPFRLHCIGPNALSGAPCLFHGSQVPPDEDYMVCSHSPFEDIVLPKPEYPFEMGQRKSS